MATNKIENLKIAKNLMSKMHSFGISIAVDRQAYDRMMVITKALTSTAMKGGEAFAKAVNDAENFVHELSALDI